MSDFESTSGPLLDVPDDVTLPQFILDSAHPARPVRTQKNAVWLIEEATGRKIGSSQIQARVFGLANALSLKWAIHEDDVVFIFSPNHVDYTIAVWAIHRLGAVVTAANPSYSSEGLTYQLKSSDTALVLAYPDCLQTALEAARASGIPSERVILFNIEASSGIDSQLGSHWHISELVDRGLTNKANFVERRLSHGEGRTKLAFLSFSSGIPGCRRRLSDSIPQYAVVANIVQNACFLKANEESTPWDQRAIRPGDVSMAVLPFFHNYGLVVNLNFLLFAGQTLVVAPRFDFNNYLESITKYRVTHLQLEPPIVLLLCKHHVVQQYDLTHVRFLMSGAAPLSAELIEQITKVLPNAYIGEGYGLTEATATISGSPFGPRTGKPGSVGRLVPGVRARILKPDGTYGKAGEQGELLVSGPSLTLRYRHNEKATRETFVDGYVTMLLRDAVVIDEDGDLFIVDRLKEMIKVRGYQVAPSELEGRLLTHPAVDDVCVVGVPDEFSGEVPLAFVVLEASAAKKATSNPEEAEKLKVAIAQVVADHTVNYKQLVGGVVFFDSIPKNPSGKLLRRLLREKAKSRYVARNFVPSKL
ncbi:amp dependent CoA ligase [Artomyces pyxidatus]|uniref:Amp dependent CoA ligase n=1 Tax=Artomyces pyxidatus TaxID=48021 RepID=A0ACB8T948_9AGAM|nr:amp dependent CoA ligase [Artomyces pyxidatus]